VIVVQIIHKTVYITYIGAMIHTHTRELAIFNVTDRTIEFDRIDTGMNKPRKKKAKEKKKNPPNARYMCLVNYCFCVYCL
jgi:hypothetical protein